MLVHNKIKPYMVFDGGYLPSKAGKEDERDAKRSEYKSKGMAFLRSGNRSQAMDFFQKCIDITPEIALRLIESCQQANIDYVVAPYEADAQLAYLCRTGLCDAVITEDSDLLVFGCKRLIYKMDAFGNGQLDNSVPRRPPPHPPSFFFTSSSSPSSFSSSSACTSLMLESCSRYHKNT